VEFAKSRVKCAVRFGISTSRFESVLALVEVKVVEEGTYVDLVE